MLTRSLLAAVFFATTPFALGADAIPSAPFGLSGKAAFAKPVTLRGKLGDGDIQVNLHTKEQMEDGIEGEYFYFGRSQNILLAGEIEGDDLFMEESENGTDVSGQWDGKLAGETVSGEWQSADGKIKKPFSLRVVRTEDKPKQKSAASGKTAAPNRQ